MTSIRIGSRPCTLRIRMNLALQGALLSCHQFLGIGPACVRIAEAAGYFRAERYPIRKICALKVRADSDGTLSAVNKCLATRMLSFSMPLFSECSLILA